MWVEYILLEADHHVGLVLTATTTSCREAAAARFKGDHLLSDAILLELYWWLLDDEPLLVFQNLFRFSMQDGFDAVLDLDRWFVAVILPLPDAR